MSFIRNQLVTLFTLLPCAPSKIVASLLLKVMIQNSVDHRSNEVRFTKNKTYKVGWTVRWKFTKLCLFLCFVPIGSLRIFGKKKTDLSVIQPQSSTQVKEDVLGLLGIEGGLFGLVGRWLVFFFVVSRCGVFLPGRIHRFNDDQCVLSWNVVFSEGLLVVPKCKQFCLKTQTEDGWLFFWGHRSLNPIVSFVPPFFIRMLEFVMLSPANDECFECTRTCRTSSFQIPSVEFLDGRFYFSLRLQGFWSDSIGYLHLQGHVVKGYL